MKGVTVNDCSIEKLQALIADFSANENYYLSHGYNETELRVHFLNPFFEILGWDVANKQNLPAYMREVKHEASVRVEEEGGFKSKKPDYLFKLGSKKCFFLEAKKPCVDILSSADAAFQTRRYGWSASFGISVLCNFRDLVIYDCGVRPVEGDAPQKCRVVHYRYSEYAEKFEEIRAWLSKDSVIDGTFDEKIKALKKEAVADPFDSFFLGQVRKWRALISGDLFDSGQIRDSEHLNTYTQRVLNRILFLRLCEDHEFETYEMLKSVQTSEELIDVFSRSDSKYDSGLFEILEPNEPTLSNETIKEVLNDLYYPNGSYDFNVIDASVISQIYDLFLCEEAIIEDGKVRIVLKDDVADFTGAVCTPGHIAESIVSEVMASLLEEKPDRDWSNLRIIDMCCGSGIFLLFSFEQLLERVLRQLSEEGRFKEALSAGLIVPDGGAYRASFSLKRKVLTTSIFGVDIDPVAAEVCRLSLLIKLIEDVSPEELENYVRETGNKILPNLSSNIKVGNSLVSEDYYLFNPSAMDDFKLLQTIRPFNWNNAFGPMRFDAVVGNPPYVRVQNYVKNSPAEYEYIKRDGSEYLTAQSGLTDKYYCFVEKGVALLRDGGVLGCIVPNKFMSISNGEPLRCLLSSGDHVKKIIDFGSLHLFPGRSTYTCILVLGKAPSINYYYASIDDEDLYFSGRATFEKYPSSGLGSDTWLRPNNEIKVILDANEGRIEELSNLATLFVGLQTSSDRIYFISPDFEESNLVYFSDCNGNSRVIEKGILRPALHDVVLRKYSKAKANEYIIFPYSIDGGKAKLYSAEYLEEKYPHAYSYLLEFKPELLARSNRQMTEDNWYIYGRSQSLAKFEIGVPHLIWSVMSLGANYAYDDESTCFTGGGNGPYYGLAMREDAKESILYLQAVLNHPFVESVLKQMTNFFGGGYYAHGKQFVDKLPIRRIDFTKQEEVDCHNQIVANVERIMKLEAERDKTISSDQRELIDNAKSACSDTIERLVDWLYGIEEETSYSETKS